MGIEIRGTTGKIYTDQTGLLPVTSRKHTKYVFVLYCYDTNEIITEPLNDRRGKNLRAQKNFMINQPTVDSKQKQIE